MSEHAATPRRITRVGITFTVLTENSMLRIVNHYSYTRSERYQHIIMSWSYGMTGWQNQPSVQVSITFVLGENQRDDLPNPFSDCA